MPAYATTSELREYADIPTDTARSDYIADTVLARALDQSSYHIDYDTNRRYGKKYNTTSDPKVVATGEARAAREEKVYYGTGTSYLRFYACYELSTTSPIVIFRGDRADNNVVTGYELIATNDGLSFYMARMLNGGVWDKDQKYTVYSVFGTKDTPEAIVNATLELAAIRLARGGRSNTPFEVGGGIIEGKPTPTADVVNKFLAEYRLKRS